VKEIWVFDIIEEVKNALLEINVRSDVVLRQKMLDALVAEESEDEGKEYVRPSILRKLRGSRGTEAPSLSGHGDGYG